MKTTHTTVMNVVTKELNPAGILSKGKLRLRRLCHLVPRSEFLWDIDGFNKLKCHSFSIHDYSDGILSVNN